MKIEEVIKILIDHRYEIITLEDLYGELYDNNIQIFGDKSRVIFLKEFRTESSFYDWKNDQAIIASHYNNFNSKQRKNLYFFMIVNFTSYNERFLLEMNKVEKDYFVCKKYVLRSVNDLENIPFLLNVDLQMQVEFDYIKTFKETITNIDILHEETPINEAVDRQHYKKVIDRLVNYYFNEEIENLNETELESQILELLEIGDSDDN